MKLKLFFNPLAQQVKRRPGARTAAAVRYCTLFFLLSWISTAVAVCGNGVCEEGENASNCPDDCGIILPSTENWITIGPAPIESTIVYGSAGLARIGAAGRGTVIAVNPENHQEVYFGTANGGIWHTLDVLSPDPDWKPLADPNGRSSSDFLGSLAIGAIALENCSSSPTSSINPGSCADVWIGTGENVLRRHSYAGSGVYLARVAGGGEFPSFDFLPVGGSDESFLNGSVFNVIPESDRVYATLSLGMTANKNHTTVWAPPPTAGYGIHRCDGASASCTWTRVLASPAPHTSGDLSGLPTDLERDIANPGQYLAGIMGNGLYRSLAGDDTTWCPLNPGAPAFGGGSCPAPATGLPNAGTFDFVDVEISPNGQNMVVSLSSCPQGNVDGMQGLTADSCPIVLYQSGNAGVSWSQVPAGSPAGNYTTYSRYTHALQVLDSGAFCYGGLRLWCMNAGDAAPVEVGANTLHPDHHDIVILPGMGTGGGTLAYSSNDGGFYLARSNLATFDSANKNLVTAQFHGFGIDQVNETPADPQGRTTTVCGGLQDHGVVTFVGTRQWTHDASFGDGGECRLLTPSVRWATDWAQIRKDGTGLSGVGASFANRAFMPVLEEHVATQSIVYALESLFLVDGVAPGTPSPVQISPVFDDASYDFPAIERDDNVITSIGLAPSDLDRIYVGLYDGQVWASVAGADVSDGGCTVKTDCWVRADTGLPGGPVSAIAVNPANPDDVWAVLSRYGDQNVWHSSNAGQSWSASASGIPAQMPLNDIIFDPRDSSNATLLVGADRGVYRSENSGGSWVRFGDGLPNAPVFDIGVEAQFQRTYAATHGRGTFMLTDAPKTLLFEGWTEDGIWDIPIYGDGFACNTDECSCSVEVLRENGEVCAGPSSTDARGANIRVRDGVLGSDMPFMFNNHDVFLACFNGDCVGGATIESCNEPGNLISAVRINCTDNNPIIAPVAGECPQLVQPPSSSLIAAPDGPQPPPPPGAAAAASAAASAGTLPLEQVANVSFALPEGVELDVIPVLLASPDNGGDRQLCAARVALAAGDDVDAIQAKMIAAINSEPECVAANVSARNLRVVEREGEDVVRDSRITVDAPGVIGSQIVLGYNVSSGEADNLCFQSGNLGVATSLQLAISQLTFQVPASGAAGGELEFIEVSPLGNCRQTVALSAGDTAQTIAQKVTAAFQAPGIPGPADCLANSNPRDIVQEGDSIITIMSRDLEVCVRDENVGLTLGPHGVDMSTLDLRLRELAIYGTEGIELRDGAQLTDDGEFAAAAANGSAGATLLPDATSGDIVSVGRVELRDRARVVGDIKTGGEVIRGNNTQVEGSIQENATVRLPDLGVFLVDEFPSPGSNHEIPPGGQLELPPGVYGRIVIKPGGTLALSSGDYFIVNLQLDQGTLSLNEAGGPVKIYTRDQLILRGPQTTVSGAHPTGFISHLGSSSVFVEAAFSGTLASPNARLVLRAVPGGHKGAFFANFVEVDAHARIQFVPYLDQ